MFNKVFLKALNAGTTLAVSGVLLGSALTNSSWAMKNDEDDHGKNSHTILSGRQEQLRKYGLKIVELYNNDGITSSSNDYSVSLPIPHSSDYNDMSFSSYGLYHTKVPYLFGYSECSKNNPFEITFKPRILPIFLRLDAKNYIDYLVVLHVINCSGSCYTEDFEASIKTNIQSPHIFTFKRQYDGDNLDIISRSSNSLNFQTGVYKFLYAVSQPEPLNELRKNMFDSDFEVYKQLLVNDVGSFFYFLPKDVQRLIMDDLLMITDRK